LAQTYRPLEVVVVDDGSTDGSVSTLRGFGGAIRWVASLHQGAPVARNRGLALAKGEYIQFLDADDLLAPDKVEVQMEAAAANPDCLICGSWQRVHMRGWREVYDPPAPVPDVGGDLLREWLRGRYFACHSLLWPRSWVNRVGPWDESLACDQDGDYYLRAVLSGVRAVFVPEAMAFYRGHDGHRQSLGSSKTRESLASRLMVLGKLVGALEGAGKLEEYRQDVARQYYALAQAYALALPEEAGGCLRRYSKLSTGRPLPGTWANRLGVALLGLPRKERVARVLSRVRARVVGQTRAEALPGHQPAPVCGRHGPGSGEANAQR